MSEEMVVTPEVTEPDAGSNEAELTDQPVVEEETEATAEESENSREAESFAQMRHRIKELESENERLHSDMATKDEALGYYFEGEDKELVAIAEAKGIPLDVLKEARDEERQTAEKMAGMESELEALRADNEKYLAAETERRIAEDLAEIQKINPEIKELSDLPDEYFDIVRSGAAHGIKAYRGAMAMMDEAPKPPGKAGGTGDSEAIFTPEQVRAMSRSELRKNDKLITKSMKYW